jgi:UDP-2,3-diacylglucosamine pyrophosphatase LpxH
MKVDALFISDVHLGSKGSNAELLLGMLKEYEPKELIIVGDFIDGWLLKKRHYWTQDFSNVIRKILSYTKKGTKVTYITGNHDDFLRSYIPLYFGDNINVVNEMIWEDYFITHGDLYDGIVQMKWLGKLGSFGYELAISLDMLMKKFGYKKSLSKFLKKKVKDAVKFITNFEEQLVYQSKKRNCKGVVCGHIHTPENKYIDGIHYLNCGDWIENNSYIIYNKGKWELKEMIKPL